MDVLSRLPSYVIVMSEVYSPAQLLDGGTLTRVATFFRLSSSLTFP